MSEKITYPLQDWLQQQMDTNHWSQSNLAEELGIDRVQINRWMNRRRPSYESCLMIADYFNVPSIDVLRMAGRSPLDAEIDPVAERIKRKLDRVDLKQEQRAATLEDLINVWLRQDRQSPQ